MTQIAFLGTGLLGAAFVEAALKRGDNVTVWNRTIEKARALEKFGARVAANPADAVRGVSRAHLVLTDDAVVENVIADLRPGLSAETIILDHSTTQPAATAERARRLNAEGVRYLHCPVFIGPVAAREQKGTILAAGPRPLFDAVHADLARMAARVEYFGERPDLAAVYKLLGNAFVVGMNALAADVFAIGSGADVSSADALKILEFFNPSGVIAARGKKMLEQDYEPTWELTMARKDVRLMIETADGHPVSALDGIARRMDTLIAEGRGSDDLAVIAKDSIRSEPTARR
jgi:3-hydroxyisobutyrate dehydrogenase-like beta-hydroxyacid dehydrogenase